ncbi:signal transduction histidine kinase [Mucilaginibacter gracilis]|uniref:histidine kinase n=1 Tax=Mucilaginibacter gracilis TaxID=423350 RepID=A0A495J0T7_9SPHI|nr:hybrid sensor histidine kinase/response regulator transcription factor [Mucilaginibacter gracilis]RKR81968.1 signal transduction histidine kinase [Mucilaginibacter gracilis]
MKSKYAFSTSLLIAMFILNTAVVVAQINFKHINYKNGLIQSPISSMVQDRSGYVWIGNLAGLSRYDGNEFKNFRHNSSLPNGISHNRINKIYEDKTGRLWIATGGGLNLFQKNTEQFLHFGISAAKGGANYVTSVQEDSYGKIWVSTFKGIKIVDLKSRKFISPVSLKKTGEEDLYQGYTLSLFEDKRKTLWVGVKHGLKRVDSKSGAAIPLPEPLRQNKELAAARIMVIKQDNYGDLWFGTEEHGIFRYSERNNVCTHYNENTALALPSDWINDILIRNNEVWVATRNGVAIVDLNSNSITKYNHDGADPTSLSDNSTWALLEDKTNNVWIGTYSGNINFFYPGNANFCTIGERVGNHLGLNVPIAETILEDKNKKLWIGTLGGGLNCLDRAAGLSKYYAITGLKTDKYSNDIKSLAMDSLGSLWVGTLDGLCKFNIATHTILPIRLELLVAKPGGKFINAILPDRDGVWIGTNGAGLKLVSYAGAELMTIKKENKPNGLSDNYVNALISDGNDLWIGTQGGINRYNKITHTIAIYQRNKNPVLGSNNIFCFLIDKDRHLWMGSDGGGLCYFDAKSNRIYAIRQADGLADDIVNAIVQDSSGGLWASTNNGISHIKLKKGKLPLNGNYEIENFTSANGLLSDQFLINSRLITREGEILFGGMNGITAFYPQKIIKNQRKPEILLTNLFINNQEARFGEKGDIEAPLNQLNEISLPYNKNNITVKFSALSFINPTKNVYAYKIAGLANNDKWQLIDNKNEVSLINLVPGDYVFSVKASNNDGIWNDTGRSLRLRILPPFWKTWWAYLLYAVLTLLTLAKVVQFFQSRARLERDLYNEHRENERKQKFYQMKMDFFTNISHEIRTPLTLILSPIENLYKRTYEDPAVNKQILQVKNNAERLFRLIGELMDFRKAETGNMVLYLHENNIVPFINEIYLSFMQLAESRGIQYDFEVPGPTVSLYSDNDQLEKVFFNLLSNAFKFTHDHGRIKISIATTDDTYAVIKVTDNGKGIPKEFQEKLFTNFYQVNPDKSQPGTGVGLALSKSIIELHNGNITVHSRPASATEAGETTFTVSLPYKNSVSQNVHIMAAEGGQENLNSYKLRSEIDVLNDHGFTHEDEEYTVLITEDNADLRELIADTLANYHIIACTNGAEAFDEAVDKIPDLIVSDVMMPVMNGLELCHKIKKDERTSHIPVILLTALAAHIHQINGLQTGADIYLTKPFSTKILELSVHNLLASREAMRKKFARQLPGEHTTLAFNSADEQFMSKVLKIIDDNIGDPEFGVIALGKAVGMSKTVLYKKICAVTDMSPLDFLKSVRLQKAAMLLQQKQFNVYEVSYQVGFKDRKWFSREFKKQYGKNPSELMN